MKLRSIITPVAAAILAAGATTAIAGTANVLGPGGNPPTLDAQCHRAVMHLKVGHTVEKVRSFAVAANEVSQAQIHCLIRRKDASHMCVKDLGPAPVVTEKADHGPGKPGDEIGAAALSRWANSLADCLSR